jgi:hypothetical protein
MVVLPAVTTRRRDSSQRHCMQGELAHARRAGQRIAIPSIRLCLESRPRHSLPVLPRLSSSRPLASARPELIDLAVTPRTPISLPPQGAVKRATSCEDRAHRTPRSQITRPFRDRLGNEAKLIPETRIGTTSLSPPATVIGEHHASGAAGMSLQLQTPVPRLSTCCRHAS